MERPFFTIQQDGAIQFLINNGGYTIEVEIHDGPYNVIKNWDYTGVVDAIHNDEGKCWTTKDLLREQRKRAVEEEDHTITTHQHNAVAL
ncbi:hypothetical protein M0R45_013386 [Rubus argutus]|uniref:pyruvate decarboxylase n=1 Tax=Rubus argutus TaxID=59490 RepID=A0AAW1XJJ5_RUBAR